ncbi:MAG: U32 family peptidase [Tissierellaceae bacterium]|nr:U32 family peptidase [Tissierellaceae bacterium]
MRKIELLAPAGDLEKLKMAIIYGADAVYLGGEAFGLRKASKNFTIESISEGVKFAHERGKKVYVTLNIIPHPDDLEGLEEYVTNLYNIDVDAVIVSDPGMFSIINKTVPDLEIHMSTQASITNSETINFWHNLGAQRTVLARELSLKEIEKIRSNIPQDMELETFVHGAMCISYSGRCLLSNYMTGRDANMGDCSHACRYKYSLVEEKRPGEHFPVYEDEDGTFIMNSKDLCMIQYIPEMIKAGINSFKIEGRVKSSYYVATVIRSYRMAIDAYYNDPDNYKFNEELLDEIKKASHRDFTTGFYFGKPNEDAQVYDSSTYIRGYDFVGMVLDYDEETQIATIEQRNRMFVGDEIEIFGPGKEHVTQKIESMWDENGEEIEVAPHPQQIIKMKLNYPVEKYFLLRKFKGE